MNEYQLIHWEIEKSQSYKRAKFEGHLSRVTPQYFHAEFIVDLREHSNHFCLYEDKEKNYFCENKGIYFCCRRTNGVSLDEICYIGMTENLRKRWKSHHKYKALMSIKSVEILFLGMNIWTNQDIARVERRYINMFQPIFNDVTVDIQDEIEDKYRQGFIDGCEKTRQAASDYYLQEIAKLHTQNLELRQRLGLWQ